MDPNISQPGSELSSTFTFPPSDPMPSQERDLPPYANFSTLPSRLTMRRYSSSPNLFPTAKLEPPPMAAPKNPRGTGSKAKSFFRSFGPQTRRRASYSRRGSLTRDPLSITSIAFDPTALDIPGGPAPSRRPRAQSSFSLLRFAKGLQPHRSGNSVDSQSTSSASTDSAASSLAPPSFRKPRRTHSEGVLRSRPSTPISRSGTPTSAHTTHFPTLCHSPSTPSMFNPMSHQGRQRLVTAGARVVSSRGSKSMICTPRARAGIPTMWVCDVGCASPSASVDDLMAVDSLEVGDDPFASQPMKYPIGSFPTATPYSPSESRFLQPSDAYDDFAPRPNTPTDIRESIETLRGTAPRPSLESRASLGSAFSDDSDDGRRTRRASVLAAVDSLVRKVKGEDDGGVKSGKW